MEKVYKKPYDEFKDYPNTETPISASVMNGFMNALDAIDNRIIQFDNEGGEVELA